MKKLFVLPILTALILSSCTEKNYYATDGEQQQIRLSSQVTLNTVQRDVEYIRDGQSLSLFVTPASTPAEVLYSNVRLTADGVGGFTYGQNMFYPLDGRNVDFFAIHPYISGAALGTVQNFSVSAEQNAETNYLNSDLLHATRGNVARTNDAVQLTFSHKLSKIDFIIRSTNNLDLSALNNFEILNALPSTTITPTTGTITAAAGDPVTIRAFGVSGTALNRAEVTGVTAIVVPQTFPVGTPLFRITVGSQSYLYTVTAADGDINLAGGSKYTMTLTITPTGVNLNSVVNPWEDGGSIGNGTAEPQ